MTMEIEAGTDLHGKVLRKLLARYHESKRKMQEKHPDWDRNEEDAIAYMPPTDETTDRYNRQRRDGQPDYRTIYIPYSYALMMTAHTYWTSVFLARAPIFQFRGRRGESRDAVQKMEALIDYQLHVGDNLPVLFIWLLDKAKYGVGIVGGYWADEEETVSRMEWVRKTENGIILDEYEREKVTEKVEGFKGNRLYNIRPQHFYPDPRVPMHRLQKGEYVAVWSRIGWNTVLKGVESGQYFNEEALRRHARSKSENNGEGGSPHITTPEDSSASISGDIDEVGYVPVIEIYVELVPKDWGLGEGRSPEMWVFTVADEAVIIGAQPLGLYHNRFPFFVDEYEIDGHALFSRGLQDVTRDLNDTLTWLFNSHFHNVRQALNNQFLYDPSKVVAKDLASGQPGFMARAKPAAYGTDLRSAIHQIPVQDVTGQHLESAEHVIQVMQRVTGVNDNVMGMVDPGGRKTATEIRTSSSFSVNRLKTQAEWSSYVAWQPLAQMMVQNTQQFYDSTDRFRIAGASLEEGGDSYLEVRPQDIQGFFDFVPVDGTMPIDRQGQAMVWQQMFDTILQSEQMSEQFDLPKIFMHMMNLMGVNNAESFRVEARPDEELDRMAREGSLQALGGEDGGELARVLGGAAGESGSGRSAAGPGRRSPGTGGVDEAPRVPGLGPVE